MISGKLRFLGADMKINKPLASGGHLLRNILIASVIACFGFGGWVIAQDKVSKFLIMKLSRDQSQILCTSEVFTRCMGFVEARCLEISEQALEQCIAPLPETIILSELENDVLEACPQKVYADAGYSNEKAVECLQKALGQ